MILDPASFDRIPRLNPVSWRWTTWLYWCFRCIHWSPSWNTCRCANAGWAAGSLGRSWALGLAFWVFKRLVNCRVSWIGGPLLVLAIHLGSARWTGYLLLVSWIVSGKWAGQPWDGSCAWSPPPSPGRIYPCLWPLGAWKSVDVLALVWFWCSEVAPIFNIFPGPHSLLDFWWICSQIVGRLSSLNGIRVSISMSSMPRMSPVFRLTSKGAQFCNWRVQWFQLSKLTQVEGPDIKGCFGTPILAMYWVSHISAEKFLLAWGLLQMEVV